MNFSITTAATSLRSWLALLALGAVLVVATPARAANTIYTVGNILSDSNCDYLSVRQALAAAAAQPGGIADIRISWAKDKSLGYTWPSTDSAVEVNNPQAGGIRIIGGYASCSATQPTAGQYTRLTYTDNVDADADHTMLSISGNSTLPRYLDLVNIHMEGASDASKGGPIFGGGIKVSGTSRVFLHNSSVSGFHATTGGGVALLGAGSGSRGLYPQLWMYQGSSIGSNTANNGGGVYSLYGKVWMRGGTVSDNSARLNGGGIYLYDHEEAGDANDNDSIALLLDSDTGENIISGNSAGIDTFSGASGLGGGVYSHNGQIVTRVATAYRKFQTYILNNEANLGGGIYVQGPVQDVGGPFTDVRLYNAYIYGNAARGQGGGLFLKDAVAGLMSSVSGQCNLGFGTVRPGPCSYFASNSATGTDGKGDIPRGGAIYVTDTRSDGISRAALNVYRTWFDNNEDANGLAAVAAAAGASQLLFNRDIFTNNDAKNSGGAASALVYTHTTKDLNFRYNTVLDSNTSTRMFNLYGGTLDVTGSILWGTADRFHPFHFVWFDAGGATMAHHGCLLIRDSDSGTAGVPGVSQLWTGHAPDLNENFAPRGSSAAIDHCDDAGGAPPSDAYNRGVYQVPGVTHRYGKYDLGAVEQDDIIFTNSFGTRPNN